jgi:Ca-activated chloride channel homolog
MAPMRAALASMALGLLLLLSGCGSGPKEPFKIVSGSENTVLEPIVSEFCRSRGVT